MNILCFKQIYGKLVIFNMNVRQNFILLTSSGKIKNENEMKKKENWFAE